MKLWKVLLPVSMTVLGAPGVHAVCLGSAETNNCSIAPNPPSCIGTNGTDVIICDSACVVSSGRGDDLVVGSSGNDRICLGADGVKVATALAGNDQIRGTGNNTDGLDIYIEAGGSGNDVNSVNADADDTNALLGGIGTNVNVGSTGSVRDICSSGAANTNCEIVVTE